MSAEPEGLKENRLHASGRDAMPSTGTEALDWQEVWCMTCKRDHAMHDDLSGGCEIFLRVLLGDPAPEIIAAGYTIDATVQTIITREEIHEEVPAVINALPAAAFCTSWEQCPETVVAIGGRRKGQAIPCAEHRNGLTITGHTITKRGWDL